MWTWLSGVSSFDSTAGCEVPRVARFNQISSSLFGARKQNLPRWLRRAPPTRSDPAKKKNKVLQRWKMMRLVSERESVFWQERVRFWLMGLTQICYMQTYNQEVLENNWGSKEKWTRSALSALGFRIGGQPQSLDYGGGDKSGLTDTRGRGSPFPPPSPEPWDGNQPVWCAWDQMCEDYGLETPTARAFFFFFHSQIKKTIT